MTTFAYRGGVLNVDSVPLPLIAEQVGTPCYIYSENRIRENYREFSENLSDLNPLICYAVKACPNTAVVRILTDCGAGVDVTSAGELLRALKGGATPDKIIFSGVGKSRDELAFALKTGIHQINNESIPEMKLTAEVAASLGVKAPVALRVNPNVAAHTHHKISTGELGNKFGIDASQLGEAMSWAKEHPSLDLKGFHVHIGSHLYDYGDFQEAYGKLADMVRYWRAQGFDLTRLDLGGGVGIPYDGASQAPFAEYAKVVKGTVGNLGCEISLEPGRRLVGDAGVLLARVVHDKQGEAKRFLIVDAGMHDLIRPAMYDARHSIIPVKEAKGDAVLADVVGPVCESSDLFGERYLLPGVTTNDLVAILQAGAYGAAMASTYNGHDLVPEVLVSGDKFRVIRRRITVEEQIGWEAA